MMAVDAINPTWNVSTRSGVVVHIYDKGLMWFDLPNLGGGTFTSASLDVYASAYDANNLSMGATVSQDNTAWDETTAFATIDAITQPADLATATVTGVGHYTFDVTGVAASSTGIAKRYADAKTFATVMITAAAVVAISKAALLELGDETFGIGTDVLFDDRTGTVPPVLTITYTPVVTLRQSVMAQGIFL